MLTETGPVLLECNARFGDPETQAILPRLAVALGPLLLAAARGELADATRALGLADPRLPVLPGATVAVVLAAAGYPDAPRRGDAIERPGCRRATAAPSSSTPARRMDADGSVRTAGGRVLAVVGQGHGPDRGRGIAPSVRRPPIDWDGVQRRHDIGADLAGAAVLAGAAR